MKILHIHQYYNDGMGYQENILPKYQAKYNNEVMLITSDLSNGFNGESRKKQLGEYKEKNFIVKRIPITREFKGRFVIFKNLYKYIEEFKPDYVFHHSVTSPSLGTVCRYKKNNPNTFLVVDNHADLNISGQNKLWKLIYYNSLWKNYIEKYDKYIDLYFGVTPSRCLFLNEELGVSESKIRLLPIGADTDDIEIKETKEGFLKKYGLKENNFIIVHGGKITSEKQIDRVIKAFMQIKDKNVRFLVFGNIKDKNVEKLMKLDNRILTIGWLNRKETLEILKYSDLGIWNTQHTTLLEDSVAVGLPLILRYYGSTSHLIDNSGLFLYEGSIREIFDKLSLIINNRELLLSFKDNAKKMSEILSYDNIACESIEYKNCIKPKEIHNRFMSENYMDISFRYYRKINRK